MKYAYILIIQLLTEKTWHEQIKKIVQNDGIQSEAMEKKSTQFVPFNFLCKYKIGWRNVFFLYRF